MAVSLPIMFDPAGETHKSLARVKTKASKNFHWTSSKCLTDAAEPAFCLHVLGRDADALTVCRSLTQYQFASNYALWSPVEGVLCLQVRLANQLGEANEAEQCVRRVRETGFVARRLEGQLFDPSNADRAVQSGDKAIERGYRLALLHELGIIIELGGSAACPPEALERTCQENLTRLRELLG